MAYFLWIMVLIFFTAMALVIVGVCLLPFFILGSLLVAASKQKGEEISRFKERVHKLPSEEVVPVLICPKCEKIGEEKTCTNCKTKRVDFGKWADKDEDWS